MGMFDNIKCKFPLPLPQYQSLLFQTKDTPSQFLDLYEIREDGSLWVEDYDIEDHSLAGKWERQNPGKPLPSNLSNNLESFLGRMTRVNERWKMVENFTGEIRFYETLEPNHTGWVEFSAYFESSQLIRLNLIKHKNENPSSTST